ncbi:MAG: HNH endonuclease [Bacteroidota bacterium]
MGLTAEDFRRNIFELVKAENREFAVNEFYSYLGQKNILLADDLLLTTLKGYDTKEPRWKRNLRNVLQQLKVDGELVNSRKDYWRLPTPVLETRLDTGLSWQLIYSIANEALQNKISWLSSQKEKAYRVKHIEPGFITIYREQPHNEETLNEGEVNRAITALNAAGGFVGRRTLNNIVAKEAAIVFLHPLLDWFEDGNQIGVVKTTTASTEQNSLSEQLILKELENDQIDIYDLIKRKKRKAQDRFKANLMKVYGGQCCVSRVNVESTLSGAHIEPHHINGNNSSCNGLLLRADIHKLFDDDLIAINPQTLEVIVHQCLRDTIYDEFNGQILLERLDGKRPSEEILAKKWKVLKWLRNEITSNN